MTDETRRTLADRLNYLFGTVRPAGGREFSNEQVAAAIRESQGVTISQSYIWQLRNGQKDNPTMRHLEALAAFFGVPPAYFFDEQATERVENQLALVTAMRDAHVRDIALRTMQLDDTTRESIARIVAEISQMRGPRPGPAPGAGQR